MNEEKNIVIVEDDNNIIKFDDVTIKHDVIDRSEVARVEEEIARLKAERISIDDKIVDLEAKLAYAKKVIEIADAQKNAVVENEVEASDEGSIENVEVGNTEVY